MKTTFKHIISIFAAVALISGCQDKEQATVSVDFKQKSYEMTVGEALDLASELKVENSNEAPVFKSSASAVASVNNDGVVSAVAAGEAVITATVAGKSATCNINVSEIKATALNLSCPAIELAAGVAETITATWEPEGYNPSNLEWTCEAQPEGIFGMTKVSDSEYSVNFTEYQEGAEASVTVTDKLSGISKSISFTVKPEVSAVTVSKIVLNETQLFKKIGDAPIQLVATCYDDNNEVVENFTQLDWSATKEEGITAIEVVEVSQSGLVTIKAEGTSVITVKNRNNASVYATCTITVSAADVVVESITLSPSAKTIKVGETFTISALVTPDDAVDKTLTYTSSDNDVAVVTSAGSVEGITEGKAVITVTAVNGVKATCNVTVSNDGEGGNDDAPDVESIVLEPQNKSYELPQLETVRIIAYYGPDGAAPKTTSWKSSETSLATVDEEGNVTAVASSIEENTETYVTITHTADNQTATIRLQIVRALPKVITFTAEPEGKKLLIGETFQYAAEIKPDLADQSIIWQCYDAEGASILNGINFYDGTFRTGGTTKIGVGKYKISAKASANQSVITFTEVEVLPIGIVSASLNYEEVELNVGAFVNLQVTFNPSNATYKDIVWKSSDESVATVADGKVTAVSAGSADITATLTNGTVLTCKVTVKESENAPKVGDFYYSDGTWSTELDASKTPVGIVFSIDNVTLHDSKLAADHAGCTHGIVVSLKETAAVKWQEYGAMVSSWAESNGYMPTKGIIYSSNTFQLDDNGKKLCGYNNTKAIEAYMESQAYTDGGNDAKIHLLDKKSSMTDIEGTSGWYVPSIAELQKINENSDAILQKITAAGGTGYDMTGYWTSTEGDILTQAGMINLKNGTESYNASKWDSYKVRYVFAF